MTSDPPRDRTAISHIHAIGHHSCRLFICTTNTHAMNHLLMAILVLTAVCSLDLAAKSCKQNTASRYSTHKYTIKPLDLMR